MILDWLEEWFKGVLIDGITSNLTGLFDTVNTKVGEIAADVGPRRRAGTAAFSICSATCRKR